jgi:NAD+ synthase (glutamine-hydrolysing)
MKIALGQINTTIGDIDANVEKIIVWCEKAKAQGAQLIIFPELAVCGYPPMDLLLKESFVQANLAGLEKIKTSVSGITALVGFVAVNPGAGRPLHNALAVISENEIKAVQFKTLLPTYDVFDEDRYFEPASEYVGYAIGDFKFGLSICEDIWNYKQIAPKPRYQIDPIDVIAQEGNNVLINVSASPFSLGKQQIRQDLIKNQAISHSMPVFYVNLVGANDQLVFDGRSMAVDSQGNLVAQAKAFEEDLIFVEMEAVATKGGSKNITLSGSIHAFSAQDAANTHAALVLGVRDYMQKCGFKKAVVGLSGGIDSAVTCALAVEAIGAENVLGVAMPSPYSSKGSIDDAQKLADNLKVAMHTVPIEPAMLGFQQILTPEFADMPADVTEENLQARIRGSILMALSNKYGYLVLTTGNKSELAVGYCTLYGDMCGGLAVISDLPKMAVYALADYINEHCGRQIIPQSTIEKAPSAELRPGQKDQDTLPPYPVLDAIINCYVEQRLKPDEIVNLGYQPETVLDVITRIDRNEYKRKQAAPGLKVTARAFGVGWRMPIAQRFKEAMAKAPNQQIPAK